MRWFGVDLQGVHETFCDAGPKLVIDLIKLASVEITFGFFLVI
jgi:hypothetical protein